VLKRAEVVDVAAEEHQVGIEDGAAQPEVQRRNGGHERDADPAYELKFKRKLQDKRMMVFRGLPLLIKCSPGIF
jgi:hypothetical protein